MTRKTPQLEAWAGEFGNTYIDRNEASPDLLRGKTRAWGEILRSPQLRDSVTSILEIGANIGLNLRAIANITNAELFAVEPNETARNRLANDCVTATANIFGGSAEDIPLGNSSVDLAFTSTVLIHVPPESLLTACKEIHRVSRRFIICNEYFSVNPETIEYQGRKELLFKRDFGAFWLDNFSDLELVDYGFLWRQAAAMDSTTWWLFAKKP